MKEKGLDDYIGKLKEISVYDENSEGLLVELFARVRPDYYGDTMRAERNMRRMLDALKADPVATRKLRFLIIRILRSTDILELFTISGVETEPNFFVEFRRRFRHKFLPPFRKPESIMRVIDTVFYKASDYHWVEKIDPALWTEFFSLLKLGMREDPNEKIVQRLDRASHVISCRIVALVSDKEIRDWLMPEELDLFIRQDNLSSCRAVLARLRSQSVTAGTSLQQTYLIRQISQLIFRKQLLAELSDKDHAFDVEKMVSLFKGLVYNENTKNSISKLIKSNIQVLAYRVAEHEHDTGEHYITSGRKEYIRMLISALGGGVFAALMAFFKTILHKITMAPFWQGFVYSLNYSGGFLTIFFTGSTLATKQPAMTASSIAGAMDERKGEKANMSELAVLLSQVWRSQTASFVGNLSMAFPVALVLAIVYALIFRHNIVDLNHAQEMLDWQNPLKSNCLMYACNTGVFLYLSGIVSGFIDNRVIHGKIPKRIMAHPFLVRYFPPQPVERLARYVEKNLGPIVGNVFLGFCLGMAAFLGYIFGIDFDIRHITISTGQFAIGLQGLGYHVGSLDLIMTIIGVLLIGFLNFLVSFALAFFTASISRGVQFRQYRHLMIYLRRLLFRYPLDFVYPPKQGRTGTDLLKKRGA